MKSRDELNVTRQVRIGEDGSMEADSQTETDLADWGVVEEQQERETRIEQEAASEFGVDDRSEVEQTHQTEQETLTPDVEQDQQTLGGEQAATQSKW